MKRKISSIFLALCLLISCSVGFLSTEENLQRVVFGDYVFIKDNGVYYLRDYIGRDSVIRLPETVEGSRYNIDSYAFYGKTTLREVEIPKGVISIGYAAFSGCFK